MQFPGRPRQGVRARKNPTLMKDKSKVVLWLCFTVLAGAGMKYVPPYLLEQRKLDIQDRALDLQEEAFLHQQVAPRASVPAPIQDNRGVLL